MTEEINQNEGLTRREALKKGARLGGALVWAVPVVQTVGMTPAMAQTVSEGTCCMRIDFTEPIYDPVDELVKFTWRLSNCGSETITSARGRIEVSGDGGTNWEVFAADNKFTINSGQTSNLTPEDGNLPTGTYVFRMRGLFNCLGTVDIWHTIPGGGPNTYLNRGPLVIP